MRAAGQAVSQDPPWASKWGDSLGLTVGIPKGSCLFQGTFAFSGGLCGGRFPSSVLCSPTVTKALGEKLEGVIYILVLWTGI